MKRKFHTREYFLIAWALFVSLIVLFGGRNLSEVRAKDSLSESVFQELKVFTDVLSIVRRDYVEPVETNKLVKGAIKGMLATLDPHSGYLDPDFYKDFHAQTKGEFGGLGIEITIKDGLLIVVAPMEGSPAEEAGIIAGDAIVKIEGKYTKEYSLVDAVKKLRGPKGSAINISIARKGVKGLIDVRIIRDKIEIDSVRSRYLKNGIGYARISQFVEKTSDSLKSNLGRLEKAADSDLKGLILDLRNNPGGLLTQAIRVSDLFLKEGLVVYTDGRVPNQRQKFYAHTGGTEPDYPIVVLVNEGSASASEIIAGAFQDHGRALVLGKPTFGKGSVQTITPLPNGGAVTLTTALYYTKSGNSLQAKGIVPDIIVEPKIEAEEKEDERYHLPRVRERDLPGAIKNPSQGEKQDGSESKGQKLSEMKAKKRFDLRTVDLEEWFEMDPQLEKATELLQTFNVFSPDGKILSGESIEESGALAP